MVSAQPNKYKPLLVAIYINSHVQVSTAIFTLHLSHK